MSFVEYTKKINCVEWADMEKILNLLDVLFDCQGIQEVNMYVDGH